MSNLLLPSLPRVNRFFHLHQLKCLISSLPFISGCRLYSRLTSSRLFNSLYHNTRHRGRSRLYHPPQYRIMLNHLI